MLRSPEKLDLRPLSKLLLVMTNLLKHYFSQVPEQTWCQLMASLSSQSDAIATLIEQDNGPKRKQRARSALANLTAEFRNHPKFAEKAAS